MLTETILCVTKRRLQPPVLERTCPALRFFGWEMFRSSKAVCTLTFHWVKKVSKRDTFKWWPWLQYSINPLGVHLINICPAQAKHKSMKLTNFGFICVLSTANFPYWSSEPSHSFPGVAYVPRKMNIFRVLLTKSY